MVHVSAPGKLMIAGEWAIMEPGNPCIVAAIDKRVHAFVDETDKSNIELTDFKIKTGFEFTGEKIVFDSQLNEDDAERMEFAKAALESVFFYLSEKGKEIIPVNVRISGGDSHETSDEKIGFGYFASVMVSTIAGVLKLYDFDLSKPDVKELIFKLSSVAYYFTPGKGGSCYNIAASVYGDTLIYRRFDGKWLIYEVEEFRNGDKGIKDITERSWPGLFLKRIAFPKDMILIAGWTGMPFSAHGMVRQMNAFKTVNLGGYEVIAAEIKDLVDGLAVSIATNDKEHILLTIKRNEDLLSRLGKESGVEIETIAMRRLCLIASRNGAAGKVTGAGRSNYGIAVCFDNQTSENIKRDWQESGIVPVDVSIDHNGVMDES